ncbi:MAG: ribosome maturation factor RimP [Alphaproteobacteria bacterium]
MKIQPLEQKIADIVHPALEELGFELYCVKITGEDGSTIVQIMAQDPATGKLGVDDCAKISREVSTLMEVEDPISGKYRLEVSSPGIDRFLFKLEHFENYKGFEVKVESDTPAENGQRKFRGRIEGINDNNVLLKTDQGDVEIPFGSMVKAKLVMTDELIKATANL